MKRATERPQICGVPAIVNGKGYTREFVSRLLGNILLRAVVKIVKNGDTDKNSNHCYRLILQAFDKKLLFHGKSIEKGKDRVKKKSRKTFFLTGRVGWLKIKVTRLSQLAERGK
jgi:hypothetical protein